MGVQVPLAGVLFIILFAAGCVSSTGVPVPGGLPANSSSTLTPSPNASLTPGPLTVSPSTLSFGAASSASQTVTITDAIPAPYTVSGCSGTATANIAGSTITVTSVAAGNCTLLVSDLVSNKALVTVTVTTVSVPVQ